jgi:hypothetical protein
MKNLTLAVVALLVFAVLCPAAEAACGRARRAARGAGKVAKLVLPPYGR